MLCDTMRCDAIIPMLHFSCWEGLAPLLRSIRNSECVVLPSSMGGEARYCLCCALRGSLGIDVVNARKRQSVPWRRVSEARKADQIRRLDQTRPRQGKAKQVSLVQTSQKQE